MTSDSPTQRSTTRESESIGYEGASGQDSIDFQSFHQAHKVEVDSLRSEIFMISKEKQELLHQLNSQKQSTDAIIGDLIGL